MSRLLLDQGLAPAAAKRLREQGVDAVHVIEIGMDRGEDADILEYARNAACVCVTLDHDFHAHLALTRRGNPSVVLLRTEGLNAEGQPKLIRTIRTQCEIALVEGAAVFRRCGNHPCRTAASAIGRGSAEAQSPPELLARILPRDFVEEEEWPG